MFDKAILRSVWAAAALVALSAAQAQAETIVTVPVGNPNANDTTGYGGVSYAYNIGKYEVTNAQYTEFLNGVDPNGTNLLSLYISQMGFGFGGIGFSPGNPSGSKYAVLSGRGNMPVNFVSFWDACRFANWLGNGQGSADTENGAYTLTTDGMNNNTVTRNANWTWAVASENEWYKAAYYDPNKAGGAGYWLYPTGSNNAPTAEGPPGTDATNGSANCNGVVGDVADVGAYTYKPSTSPYGTFDQGGNVWEWNEAIRLSSSRGSRGGAFSIDSYYLLASYDGDIRTPVDENFFTGFRVASVPEPGSLAMLAGIALTALLYRWRKHV